MLTTDLTAQHLNSRAVIRTAADVSAIGGLGKAPLDIEQMLMDVSRLALSALKCGSSPGSRADQQQADSCIRAMLRWFCSDGATRRV